MGNIRVEGTCAWSMDVEVLQQGKVKFSGGSQSLGDVEFKDVPPGDYLVRKTERGNDGRLLKVSEEKVHIDAPKPLKKRCEAKDWFAEMPRLPVEFTRLGHRCEVADWY